MTNIKRLAVLIISLTIPLSLSPVYGQPFWTEKSIYSDGEYLFAVGIATNVSNKEDGRIEAFDHGVREVCKLKGVTKLTGVDIRTQMTYEEEHEGGTYTIWRLLRIKEDALKKAVQKPKPIRTTATASKELPGRVRPHVETWPSGNLKAKGYFKRVSGTDIKIGKWTWWYENGREQAKENYKDGLLHGQAIYWNENGQKQSEGEYQDGKKNGRWRWVAENGNTGEDEFRDGKKHGKSIVWYKSGQKCQEIEWRDGQVHGKWLGWYENGKKNRQSKYEEGKIHGKSIGWYENGKKQYEDEYRDGLLCDATSETPFTGKITLTYPNGKKQWEREFRDGKEHGKSIQWYENGQKKSETESQEGQPHGKWIFWYENGQKSSESEWRDGKPYGKWIDWDENGYRKDGLVSVLSKLPEYSGCSRDEISINIKEVLFSGDEVRIGKLVGAASCLPGYKGWSDTEIRVNMMEVIALHGISEPDDKYSIKEFAEKIKEIYPAYNNLDDEDLVQRMIKKYPQYKSWVDIPE